MMKRLKAGMMIALLLVSGLAMAAGNADRGRDKAASCAGCHGATGISVSPQIPSLAGRKEAYLVKALNDFRTGNRKDPMMTSLVKGLSDEDVADLAAFFSAQKPASD